MTTGKNCCFYWVITWKFLFSGGGGLLNFGGWGTVGEFTGQGKFFQVGDGGA